MIRPNLLTDALVNVCRDSGASDDYSRGLVVGVVAALMAETGRPFDRVWQDVVALLPVRYELVRLPLAFALDMPIVACCTGDDECRCENGCEG
jgi:hypothetical protein